MDTIEIVLCTACGGKGETQHEELVDYHKKDYRYWSTPCTKCDGCGRLKKVTTTKFMPFIGK